MSHDKISFWLGASVLALHASGCGSPVGTANAGEGGVGYPTVLQCAEWDVRVFNSADECERVDLDDGDACELTSGWEPMNIESLGFGEYLVYARRCVSVNQ